MYRGAEWDILSHMEDDLLSCFPWGDLSWWWLGSWPKENQSVPGRVRTELVRIPLLSLKGFGRVLVRKKAPRTTSDENPDEFS